MLVEVAKYRTAPRKSTIANAAANADAAACRIRQATGTALPRAIRGLYLYVRSVSQCLTVAELPQG